MDNDKNGRMVCPGCGKSDYEQGFRVVVCVCGCRWDINDMLFAKEVSQKGRERKRRD